MGFASDDVVRDHGQGEANARPPLLVVEPLLRYLDERGFGAGEVEATPIGEGHSCVTVRIERGNRRLILRRPPRPPVLPSTHDVLREARVLQALAGSAVPVPEVLAVCADEGVIGAPFYLMEEIPGQAITGSLPEALDNPEQRREVALRIVETLAALQAVDWRAAGLEGFGRPDGYMSRQLRRFTELWEANRTRELPAVPRVARWLGQNVPESPPATIVHGDYRLGNAMFGLEAPAKLNAVLDWEMSTLGDPLADLGYMVVGWREADDPASKFDLSPVTREPGFPGRRELVSLYEQVSGREARQIEWYTTFALFKSAVFMEGNHRRASSGGTDDPYLHEMGPAVVDEIAARAEEIGPGGRGIG